VLPERFPAASEVTKQTTNDNITKTNLFIQNDAVLELACKDTYFFYNARYRTFHKLSKMYQ
jgi:hypothetical protein